MRWTARVLKILKSILFHEGQKNVERKISISNKAQSFFFLKGGFLFPKMFAKWIVYVIISYDPTGTVTFLFSDIEEPIKLEEAPRLQTGLSY